MQDILDNGRVEGHEIELLRRDVYANGAVDRKHAEALVEVHKRVQRVSPGFEEFFYKAIKDYLLAGGPIDRVKTDWLRSVLLTEGKVTDREKKFLKQLRGEAKQNVAPEFQALCKELLGD
jgi:hypothetical protein